MTGAGAGQKLRVEHLGMVFQRDGEAVSALEDINLDVSAGSLSALLALRDAEIDTPQCSGGLPFVHQRICHH